MASKVLLPMRSEGTIKIEPNMSENPGCGFQVDSIPWIKTEPASPIRDNNTDNQHSKVKIVYEECVKGEIEIEENEIQEEINRWIKKETEVDHCHEEDPKLKEDLANRDDNNIFETLGDVQSVLEPNLVTERNSNEEMKDSTRNTLRRYYQQPHRRGIKQTSNRFVKSDNSREKNFTCDLCGTSFSRKGTILRHLRTHTGKKPFTCNVCKTSFSTKPNLSRHTEEVHTSNGKLFRCDICGISFSRKGSVTRHMLTHTGERPFICDVCEASFSRKSILSDHIRTHTRQKPFKCDVCKISFSLKSTLYRHIHFHKKHSKT